MVHTCNPSYSGGRDQEDQSSTSAGANSSRDPIRKYPSQKGAAGGVTQDIGPDTIHNSQVMETAKMPQH
jgi:hypothetical protein